MNDEIMYKIKKNGRIPKKNTKRICIVILYLTTKRNRRYIYVFKILAERK